MKDYETTQSGIKFTAGLLLIMLCFLWGGNIVSIKISSQGIPPILAATLRSVVASILLWLHAQVRGESIWLDRTTLKHGIAIGFLFGAEFLLLYWGTSFTNVSRAVVFLYTQPLWVALAAHVVLPDDRLNWRKSLGLTMAFAGLFLVFGSRVPSLGPYYWVGDLMETIAGVLWAATTIYIKKFISGTDISHYQTLFSQLFFSIPILALGVVIFEWDKPVSLDPLVVGALVYQTVIVAYLSYLVWFWMIHRFQVSLLSAFTFLTPLFGVILSGIILREPLPILLWMGLMLVAYGIYLVNKPKSYVQK